MLSRVRATGMMVSNYKSIGVAVEVVGICCWPVIVYTMAELRVSCMGSSGSYAWTSAPVSPHTSPYSRSVIFKAAVHLPV